VFDETDVMTLPHRAKPPSQVIQIYDLVMVANGFGVSTIAALFRMENLGLLGNDRRELLQDDIDGKKNKEAAEALGLEKLSVANTPGISDTALLAWHSRRTAVRRSAGRNCESSPPWRMCRW
jgi:hypothetical protein